MADLFIFAGEKSGDLHGAHLIDALEGKFSICGVGGEQMRKRNFSCLIPMEEFQVMGFIDVFLCLPKLIRLFRQTVRLILENNPKAVVTIDYPGFNLRLAKALKKRGYKGKIFHYICPSVWAWGKKRIPLMASVFDRLFSILPFEKQCFAKTPLCVDFVGHPLVSTLAKHSYRPMEQVDIAIFPGSRDKELKRNLPLLLRVARELQEEKPHLRFGLSCSHPRFAKSLKEQVDDAGLKNVLLVEAERSYDLMKHATMALAKSGTVTLELALHFVPTVVVYAISKLDLFIAKDLLRIRLPFYALPNILAQKEVFPELFGPQFNEKTVLLKTKSFLENPERRLHCQEECQKIAGILGPLDAHCQTALLIQENLFG